LGYFFGAYRPENFSIFFGEKLTRVLANVQNLVIFAPL
jgi:hypothetical protein